MKHANRKKIYKRYCSAFKTTSDEVNKIRNVIKKISGPSCMTCDKPAKCAWIIFKIYATSDQIKYLDEEFKKMDICYRTRNPIRKSNV